MAETPAAKTPTTPDAKPATPTANGPNAKKFEGEGLPFKAKLIGMEDLTIDRDEKVCLESMFKLKAVVRARGEHKQRVQINLTMNSVKIIDEASKAQIASHEIERISFVVIDPRDTRAFGYVYNTSDDRHQFWAIKTDRPAAFTVLALKELFELAFENYTNAEKEKEVTQPATTTPVSTPTQPTQAQVSSPQVANANPPTPAPPAAAPVVPQQPIISMPPPSQPQAASILDDDIWGDSSTTTSTPKPPQPAITDSIFDLGDPLPVSKPAPQPVDSLTDIFSGLSTVPASPPPPVVSPVTTNQLFNVFANPNPAPVAQPAANQYGNFFSQPTQPNAFNMTPMFNQPMQPTGYPSMPAAPQQQPMPPQQTMGYSSMPGAPQQQPTPPQQTMGYPAMPGAPQQPMGYTGMQSFPQQQPMQPQNFSMQPNTAQAPSTSGGFSFGDLDLLGNRSAPNAAKSPKDLFAAAQPQPKTIQQMQMAKQP